MRENRAHRIGLATFKPAWGERYFQVTDPNGVVIQLVQWLEAAGEGL